MGIRGPWWLVSLLVAGVALAVRLAMVLRGAGLGGMFGYDDGVYFSAAGSVSWGRLLYRDFVLLHPPGIVWALLPFAGTLTPRSIPSTVVLDAEGRVAASVNGRIPTTQTLVSLVEAVRDE